MPHALPNWPYLTSRIPPIRGKVRCRFEDFEVEEIPLYACSGEGTHVYFMIEKIGVTTLEAVRRIARALDVSPRDIGYAGLKDANAVARQVFSVEHIEPRKIESLAIPQIRILWTNRHRNKLKLGHLAGNRFKLKLRDVDSRCLDTVQEVLDVLTRRGVPNYFGHQRFGARGDTWLMGKAVMKGDPKEVVDLMCGRPGPDDHDAVARAREFFDLGQYELAMQLWPPAFRDVKRVCSAMLRGKGSYDKAYHAIDPKLKRLYVSAYQSYLFNTILAGRIETLDRLQDGDLACKHDSGAVFLVTDAAAEQPRADRLQISPTGPLFGYRMTWPQGTPGQTERQLLADEGFSLEDFKSAKPARVKGARRPLRFQLKDCRLALDNDDMGPHLCLTFTLPSGCYATAVLREILKENLLAQRCEP